MSRHNNIIEWLEQNDVEFLAAIKNCTIESLLNPRGKPGITLLLPSKNSQFRKDIIAKSYACDEASRHEVINSIAALVLLGDYNSPDVFKSQADDIPNALRQHVQIDLGGCTNDSIKFKSGATATMNMSFRNSCSKKRMHVYDLTGGTIGTDGAPAKFTYITSKNNTRRRVVEEEPAKQKPSMWGTGGITEQSVALRNRISKETENLFMMDNIQGGNNQRNIYIERVLSLIGFIFNNCSTQAIESVFIAKMLPMLSFENIDFYFFFEPHRRSGKYIIPTDLITRWFHSKEVIDVTQVIKNIDTQYELASKHAGFAAVFNNRLGIQDCIEDMREELNSVNNQRQLPEKIVSLYKKLITENNVNGKLNNGIFGDELLSMYRCNLIEKLRCDEARFVTMRLFDDLTSDKFDNEKFNRLLSIVQRYTSGDATDKSLKLLNPETLRHSINPQNKIREINTFINSKYFFFAPLCEREVKQYKRNYTVSFSPCPDGDGVWMPRDQTIDVIASVRGQSNASSSSAYVSDAERALATLRKMKASGKKFDADDRKLIQELLEETKQHAEEETGGEQ